VKLLSEPDSGSPYLHATAAHVEASAAALRVITERVTAATVRAGARPLYVRLAHLEHGAFLTTQLFGSNVLPYTGTTVPGRDAGAASRPAAALLREPFSATEEEPFTYAVVANHPVAVQVETALTALAGLLARQEVVDRLRNEDHTHVDARAAQADAQAHRTVQDAIRSRSWPAAAEALRERAIAAGRPLVVRYDSVVLDEEAPPEPAHPRRHSGPRPAVTPETSSETITHTRRRPTHPLLADSGHISRPGANNRVPWSVAVIPCSAE